MARRSVPPPGGQPDMQVGPYRLVEKLQDGVLGMMWAALVDDAADPTSIVAVRWIPYHGPVTPDVGHGLVDAARAAPWLQHELLVPIDDVAVTDDGIGIVSEYVEGESLHTLLWRAGLKREPLPVDIALRIALDVLEALAFVHEQGEGAVGASGLHADNVWVSLDGRTRLVEPSVSWYASTEEPWSTDPRLVCYGAPEVLDDPDTVDERADVFAVGVMLWELLRNRPLFGGGGYDKVVRSVKSARIARVDALRPRGAEPVPAAVADLIERALQRTPAARFSSARDMTAAIHETGEIPASADNVTDFLDTFAADSLAKQRRTVARAIAKAGDPRAASSAAGDAGEVALDEVDSEGQPDFDSLFGVTQDGDEPVAIPASEEVDTLEEAVDEEELAADEAAASGPLGRDLDPGYDDEAPTMQIDLNDLPDVVAALPKKGKASGRRRAAPRRALDEAGDPRPAAEPSVPPPADSWAAAQEELERLASERNAEQAEIDASPPPAAKGRAEAELERQAAAQVALRPQPAVPPAQDSWAGAEEELQRLASERVAEAGGSGEAGAAAAAPEGDGGRGAERAPAEDAAAPPASAVDGKAADDAVPSAMPASDGGSDDERAPAADLSPPSGAADEAERPVKRGRAKSGFDLLSIADDPSHDQVIKPYRPDPSQAPPPSRRAVAVRSTAQRVAFVALSLMIGGALAVFVWPEGAPMESAPATSSAEPALSSAPAETADPSPAASSAEPDGTAETADAGADDGADAEADKPKGRRGGSRRQRDIYEDYSPGGI